MPITHPVFVRFDNIQRPRPPKFANFNIQGPQWAKPGNGVHWAFPQPPARRKKSNLPKIKRRLTKPPRR